MSQRDLVAELRAARSTAPAELREHVRLIAARDATPPPRRLVTRRRALVVALPVAAALAAAAVLTLPGRKHPQELSLQRPPAVARDHAAPTGAATGTTPTAPGRAAAPSTKAALVPPAPGRLQRYGASLSLRLPTAARLSTAVQHALRIARSLGGYPVSVHVSTAARSGSAYLVVKVPRAHVQEAVTRLSQLGTITGEQVDIQDLEATVAAADRRVQRLQARLRALRAQPETAERDRRIEALTAQVERLQRSEAATRRSARFATLSLQLNTPPKPAPPAHHGHGPLHGLAVAFRWAGIGALYALALGVPVLLLVALLVAATRVLRRRREDALLAR